MTLRLMLGGLKSLLPVFHGGYKGAVGHTTGAYCYSVWMRHQTVIAQAIPPFRPKTVVELGPGDSLGIGCAALLSGAERYIGLDVVDHASPEHDVLVLDELVRLFERRAPIPDDQQFPNLLPRLASYAFPERMFADDGPRNIRVDHDRVESIRAALLQRTRRLYDDVPLGYLTPWHARAVDRDSIDLVITQAVLQDMAHGDRSSKLADTFAAMTSWLRTGGVMSHQINFAFPGGEPWNHHWRYSDAAWRVVRGNRPFFENRAPLSTYLDLCAKHGCEVVSVKRVVQQGLPRDEVAPRFRDLPADDFDTASAHIVAVKR
ncbi:MAG: hypothetical protein JWL95_620 [Gemmatimonadetes bacterium]|nr:hypothetical protein [Gemmatimonadota bacterium]